MHQAHRVKSKIKIKASKNITDTSQGSIIPNEPGKNSPDERSWKARLKCDGKKYVLVYVIHYSNKHQLHLQYI